MASFGSWLAATGYCAISPIPTKPRHAHAPYQGSQASSLLAASVLLPAQRKPTGWQTGDVWCRRMRAHRRAQHNPAVRLCVNAQVNPEAAHIGMPAQHRPPKYELKPLLGHPPSGPRCARPRIGLPVRNDTTRDVGCQSETVGLLENRRMPCNQKEGSAARCAVSIRHAPLAVLRTHIPTYVPCSPVSSSRATHNTN